MGIRSKGQPYPFARVCTLLITICTLLMMSHRLLAQRVDFTYKTYGLAVEHDNVIHNAVHLNRFFERLHQLQSSNEGRVNIVHIGDSHIQADYLTSIVRRHFHRHFGNAGRGLIVPLRVARTNEPTNYRTASKVAWRSKRCVFPDQPLPIGIGGVTIETTDANANLEIAMNDLWLDYTFNALTLFYEKDESSYDFSLRDMRGEEVAHIQAFANDTLPYRSRVAWEEPLAAINVKNVKNHPYQKRALIYGAVLENSKSGVLYHTIGVNGAKYRHYHEARHFALQTAALETDLFIISLGTNESVDYPHVDKNFSVHVDQLLTSLQKYNPDAAFLLVTPQDVFRQKNKPNPGIREVRDQIIGYAVEHGLAFYDLYRAMGGDRSAKRWTENTLLSTDGIHLTKDGYEYQGNLFYHALMKSYNSYVPNRHP